MSNRDHEFPFDGDDLPLDIEALLRDFPERLNRLKQLSGLSWSGFARVLGVDRKQTRRWSNGAEPCGGSLLSVFHLANRIPGGLDILLGLLTEPDLPGEEEDEEEREEQEERADEEEEGSES